MQIVLLLLLSMVMIQVHVASEKIGCQPTEFRCGSGQCVDGGRYCDGNHDCYDGTDEPEQCTNCNRTYYGLLDVKYPLRLSERRSPTCTLSFVAAGGKYGDRVEITFLSFHIGTYDFDSTSCLRGYMEVEDSRPVNPRKRSIRVRRGKGVPRRKGYPRLKGLKSASGSFCGGLIGSSATFYSTGDQVKLTVFVPPQGAAGQPVAPRLYLTYRFLEMDEEKDHSMLNGNIATGSKCDAVITNCHFRKCVIRSPNYPGFYLRNISCLYWVRQDSAPPGKSAHIEVNQINEFKINIPSGHTNNDKYKPGTLTSECAGDTIKIYDGRTIEAPLLAEFCGAGPLPTIRSSGPDILVQLVSVPSQPLAKSHFELDVHVHFARNPSAFRVLSEGCSVTVDGSRYPVGVLKAPDHSLPSGTTCTYRVTGKKPTDRVWFYFASYHVPDLHPWTDNERCDVGKLEIIHTVPKVRHSHHHYYNQEQPFLNLENHIDAQKHTTIETFCEKRSPKQCGHASDYFDLVPSRPCTLPEESYLSTGPELLLKMSYLAPLAIRGNEPYFTARYEVVDTINTRHGSNNNPCLILINSRDSPTGTLESPKNVFLYGRGGSKDLNCKYALQGTNEQKVLITVEDIHFSNTKVCETVYESVVQRHNCNIFDKTQFAAINVTEMWQDYEVFVGCVCDSSDRFTLESVGHSVLVEFVIKNMGPKDDFRTFSFRLMYEFVPASAVCQQDNSLPRILSDSKGHLSLRLHNALPFRCRWLLAALPSRALYITVKGTAFHSECKNKIIFFSAYNREPYIVYCASVEENYENFFTESWKPGSQYLFEPDLTFVEFVVAEPGYLQVKWIEVRRPGTNHCPIECPELEACIGEELACDGIHHCPVTANDESPDKCVTFPFTLVAVFSSAAVALITMILLLFIIRHRLKISTSKSVIPPPEMYRNDCKLSSLAKPPVR